MLESSFLSVFESQVLIGDGAMGTYIYTKGVPLGGCYEELNISNPHLIRIIHKEYVDAGAEFIETNTFTANRLSLKRHELSEKVKEINYTGAKIAREVAGKNVFVGGSVGPLTGARKEDDEEPTLEEKYDVFSEQILALAEGGCDALIIETSIDLDELKCALKVAKDKTNLPVICQMTFSEKGKTAYGVSVAKAVSELEKAGADVIGANCGVGPLHTLKVIEEMGHLTKVNLSAFPNAGLPEYRDGRVMYLSTPEYVANMAYEMVKVGANLVGGCCGTTPADIRMIAQKLKGTRPAPRIIINNPLAQVEVKEEVKRKPPKKETFIDRIGKGIVMVVELDPPKNMNFEKVVKSAVKLKEMGVDVITVGDSPLAILRMGNIGIAHLMEQKGVRTIIHLSCRDRNLIGLQSAVMEADALGITSILAVTGDPAKLGDQQGSTSVYDLNSFKLIQLIRQMNEGKNYAGNSIGRPTNFYIGCAFNPNVQDINTEIRRLVKKVEAGAHYALSQPFYDINRISEVYDKIKSVVGDFPVFFGIFPLVSARNAEFLNAEVPGIRIPDTIINRMRETPEDRQKEEGILISKELVDKVTNYMQNLYLIPPFGKVDIIIELVKYINLLRRAKVKNI